MYDDLKAKVASNPLKDRLSYLHVGRARIDVEDSGLVLTQAEGKPFRQIPVASLTVILLEPGSIITHEAVKLCSQHKCLLIWVGEGGVRTYSAGYTDFSSSEKILHQTRMYHDAAQKLIVVRRMFERRFQEPCPRNKSVEQLRGMEGQRVKKNYQALAKKYELPWNGRFYDQNNWQRADTINRVISVGTSCLYGIVEAAILTAGYSPAVGFLHSGKPLSFVYDIGALYKDEIILPLAFELTKQHGEAAETMIRHQLRDQFKQNKLLSRVIPDIEAVLKYEAPAKNADHPQKIRPEPLSKIMKMTLQMSKRISKKMKPLKFLISIYDSLVNLDCVWWLFKLKTLLINCVAH